MVNNIPIEIDFLLLIVYTIHCIVTDSTNKHDKRDKSIYLENDIQ